MSEAPDEMETPNQPAVLEEQTPAENAPASQNSPPPKPTTAEWTFTSLLGASSNFKPVHRVPASLPPEELAQIISDHQHRGIPLIVEGWHLKPEWQAQIHTPKWLAENFPNREQVLILSSQLC